mgnify:CR=1 FL=1
MVSFSILLSLKFLNLVSFVSILQQIFKFPVVVINALLNGLIQKLLLFFDSFTDYLVYLFPITYTYDVRMIKVSVVWMVD